MAHIFPLFFFLWIFTKNIFKNKELLPVMGEEEHLVPWWEMNSSHPETVLLLRLPSADYVVPKINWSTSV